MMFVWNFLDSNDVATRKATAQSLCALSSCYCPIVDAGGSRDKPHEAGGASMGRRWIRWMHKRSMKEWVVPGVIATLTLVKFAIGLGSYSGW
jgi:hypothetical protein